MTPDDQRWFDSWGASHYDPRTREIVLVGDPPAYVLAHEQAHAAQHARRTWRYLFWQATQALNRFARLLLELDADRRAVAALRAAGAYDEVNAKASRLVMASYFGKG